MKTNTIFTTILLIFTFAMITQSTKAQTARQVSKIGLYLIDPIKGSLPSQVQITTAVPPVTLESERDLFPHLSLGTELGGMKMDIDVAGVPSTRSQSVDFKQSVIFLWGMIKAVANFHVTKQIEIYGSMGIGYSKAFITSNNDDFNAAVNAMDPSKLSTKIKSTAIGANVFLSDNFGFFGEAGLKDSKGMFKVGIVFKRQ
ncbi:MAG: hypothetical protein HKN76_19120 [Saprospiraceae bacterium]|nr:hypothetical protein [Saprospiraceae bacterium]